MGRGAFGWVAWHLAGAAAAAAVVTDGTLGPAGPIIGPNYTLPATLGQTRGSNLFHSFTRFDLSQGEVASFSGAGSIHNVLARVTGGAASHIDGTIQCTIPGANFYLVNPAGVVFGPHAAVDVQGSFAVTTADVVKLADGGVFHAATPSASVLTTAAPAAFGFLAARPPSIAISGSALSVPDGKTIAIAGGGIRITNGALQAAGGAVHLAAVASAGNVTLDPQSLALDFDGSSPPAGGDVSLSQQTVVAVDGAGGGRVTVHAANLSMNAALITAATSGATDGAGVSLNLSGNFSLVDSALITDTSGVGRAGPIDLIAAGITLDSGGDRSLFSGLSARSLATASGRAGDVHLAANSLTVTDGAQVSADTSGTGPAGSVRADVASVLLDAKGLNRINDPDPLAGTGLFARTVSTDPGGGAAGAISIHGSSIRVVNGAAVSAESDGTGSAGGVSVTGGAIILDDAGLGASTGMFADAANGSAGGPRGAVTVAADSLRVSNGAALSASAFGTDAAGTVTVTAPLIVLNGPLPNGASVISASAFGTGDAGVVSIHGGMVQLTDGSLIAAATSGTGKGGTIQLLSDSLLIDSSGGIQAESVPASPGATRAGDAGIISVQTGGLTLRNGGTINVGTGGPGRGGSITVTANDLTADGTGTQANTGLFADSNTAAGQSSPIGPAGTITVTAGSMTLLTGGSISASSAGSGAGGNLNVMLSGPLRIDGSGTGKLTGIATTAAGSGAGGGIVLRATSIDVQNQGQISSDTSGSGRAGTLDIGAASMTLLSGGTISSDTLSAGAGGDVLVNVTGPLAIDSQFSPQQTGISANSRPPGAGGNAGAVRVTAGSIDVRNGGTIESDTHGLGGGGTVTITSSSVVLTDGPGNRFTGFAALSLAEGASGPAGTVSVRADVLHVSNGARISSESFGSGTGGDVTVEARTILLDDPDGQSAGGIVADAAGGGRAGNVIVTADSLQVASAALISSGTFGTAPGGNVTVNARQIILDGSGTTAFTGLSAESNSTGAGGNAGDITISAGFLAARNGAEISSTTFGTGAGGAIRVAATNMQVVGLNSGGAAATVGSSADGLMPGAGAGGNVTVRAASLVVSDRGLITTDTAGPGAAGGVNIFSRTVAVSNQGVIASTSSGSGEAGAVTLGLTGRLAMLRGAISTGAPDASGGGIQIAAAGGIRLTDSAVSAEAAGNGGNVRLVSPRIIHLLNSSVATDAQGGNGGNITIDPSSVVLDNSQVTATGGVDGGNVTIRPQVLLASSSPILATGRTGVSGSVLLTDPNPQLAGGLVQLPGGLDSTTTRLLSQCGLRLDSTSVSSFILTGAGGEPPAPGGFLPDSNERQR